MDRAARGRWALPALFFGSIVESSLLPWPIEFPLLTYMLRGRPQVVHATLVVALGSAVGCVLSYWAGRAAYELVFGYFEARPGLEAALVAAGARINAYGALAVGLAMMSPVPVQVASFAAGAAAMSPGVFFLAAFIGRLIRYGAMGGILYVFGPHVLVGWRRLPVWVRQLVVFGFIGLFTVLMLTALYWVVAAPVASAA